MSVIIKDMQMPSCCNECPMLDDHGDYPFCILTRDQRGYNFDTFSRRMDSCPLEDADEALSTEALSTGTTHVIRCRYCGRIYYDNSEKFGNDWLISCCPNCGTQNKIDISWENY